MQEQMSFFEEAEEEVQRIQKERKDSDSESEGYWDVYAWVTGPGVKTPFTEWVDTVFATSRGIAIAVCAGKYKIPRHKQTAHHGMVCVNYSAERAENITLDRLMPR